MRARGIWAFPQRGDAIRDFLAIGPAGAFIFRISTHLRICNIASKRQGRIETYDRAVGSTRRFMRFARNLQSTALNVAVVQGKCDRVAAEKDHLKKLSDSLASQAVSET